MRRKTISWIIGLALLAGSLAAVAFYESAPDDEDEGGLGVVVTIAPQEEMARRVGGELVRVTVMVPEGADPHSYEPAPSQMKSVAEAGLYFSVGSGLEFENAWMERIEAQNDDMLVVDGHVGVTLLDSDGDVIEEGEHEGRGHEEREDEEEEEGHEEEGEDEEEGEGHEGEEGVEGGGRGTRADDHDHVGADPHVWMSLRNGIIMVENLRDGLVEVDPDNAEAYRENAKAYIAELEALDGNITVDLAPHFGEKFLVYHPSFGYFAHDYGLVQMAIEEEGKEPGSAGLAAVIDQAKEHDISVVFVSPQFSQESARAIADEIGGEVLTLNSLAGDYLDNIGEISQKLISALGEVGP